jgi:hypothetical protein
MRRPHNTKNQFLSIDWSTSLKPAEDGHKVQGRTYSTTIKTLVRIYLHHRKIYLPYTNSIALDVASSNLNTTPLPFPTSFRYITAFDTVHLAHTIQTAPSLDVLLTTVCGHHVQAFSVMAVCVLSSEHVHGTWRKSEQRNVVMMPNHRK